MLTDIVGQPKEFLEAGKKRLSGDTAREAMSDEVKNLRREASDLKEALAETLLENHLLKKAYTGMSLPVSEKPEIIRLVERSHLSVVARTALTPATY